jgi:uncharacterized Zn finger protein/superfamily II DNA or RNA helicase
MAYIEFGHTWWGERWLDALTNIDFENRLPRGKRYARNGSVRSIDIDGPKIAAKVKGREPSPYTITMKLWAFTEEQKQQIIGMVKESPYFLSQMEARQLPRELKSVCEEKGMRLFPENWKELSMSCSCPDWAVPCKHLAAVVYIIANEIDKNPFLVFRLHGLDLLEAVRGGRDDSENVIAGIESFVASGAEEYNYYRENLEHIDYSTVPDLYPAISRLLTEFPLFYLKNDFKEILLQAYGKIGKAVKRYVKNLELQELPPKELYTTCTISIFKGKNRFSGKLVKGKRAARFDSENFTPLVNYLHFLSAGDLSVYPPVVSFLIMVHAFALKLMEKKAIVPDIISIREDTVVIRWIPALFNREMQEIFTTLVDALPKEIVKYGSVPLEHKEQTLFLLSFFLRYYLELFAPVKNSGDDPVTALFFNAGEYSPSRFEERENAKTINLWLGRFFIRPIHYFPVIHVDETAEDIFSFDIRIGDRRADEVPMGFADFMRKDESETLPLLRDLSLLSTYLPTVNQFLREKKAVEVQAENFIETWFTSLSALRTLGVSTVVPKSLGDVFIPHLSLSLRYTQPPGESTVSYTSLAEMLEFDWNIAAGEMFIKPQELFTLKGEYGKYIRYKDRYLEISQKELDSIARRLEKPPALSPLKLLQTGLTGVFEDVPIDAGEEVEKLFRDLFTPEEVAPPENLGAVLRPYQLRGYQWLCHNHRIGLGSIVADDMGLGKTVQVIAFLLRLKTLGTIGAGKQVLIVVPASLMTNWDREIRRFAPDLVPAVYHGSDREVDPAADIIITTYALARRDLDTFTEKRWAVLVLDEAQNIKNASSAQTKAAKKIKADYRIAMTGTPVENRLLDYWSIIDFIMKGYMGSLTAFKEKYAVPIERFRDRPALDRFHQTTSPLILRRLKTDKTVIRDLPEKIVSNRYPQLKKEQALLYQELVDKCDEWLADVEGIGRSGIVFKLMTGLKQICCHPHLYIKRGKKDPEVSGKAEMLLDLLRAVMERNEKALVFTQYAEMGKILKTMIESELETPCLFLYGDTSRKERDGMVDTFQEDPEYKVMVLSIKAGGVGLNLTEANHVIHYDLWWNPAVENQATDRAFRIGQRRDVTVYRLITRGTFEEKINAMLEAKAELADLTVAQGEQWLTKLSSSEIKELISLHGLDS